MEKHTMAPRYCQTKAYYFIFLGSTTSILKTYERDNCFIRVKHPYYLFLILRILPLFINIEFL